MRILIINDDGYKAPGLLALVKQFRKDNDITVAAPAFQQTGAAHSLTIGQDFKVLKTETDGIETYAIHGTPRDCCTLAVEALMKQQPDLIISGINEGENISNDVICSGTCGGASAALYYGIPSIAVSLQWSNEDNYDYDFVAEKMVSIVDWFMKQPYNTEYVLNVNFPNTARENIKGVTVSQFGGDHLYKSEYSERFDGTYYYYTAKPAGLFSYNVTEDISGDIYALQNNYIVLTPLDVDLCHHSQLDSLRENLKTLKL